MDYLLFWILGWTLAVRKHSNFFGEMLSPTERREIPVAPFLFILFLFFLFWPILLIGKFSFKFTSTLDENEKN